MSSSTTAAARHRLIPLRRWLTVRGVSIILLSSLATVCLILILLTFGLLLDLLSHRGELMLSASETAELRTLAEPIVLNLPQEGSEETITLNDTGILPTLWRHRNDWWIGTIRDLWKVFPWLRTTRGAMTFLVTGIALLGMIRVGALSMSRSRSARLSVEVSRGLRVAIHRQALRLGPSDLDGADQRRALEMFVNRVDCIRDGLTEWYAGIVRDGLLLALLVLLLLAIDWKLAVQCLVPLCATGWIIQYERRRGQAVKRQAIAEAEAELRPLAESLRKTRLVRGFGMEEYEHDQFQKHLAHYSDRTLKGLLGETWALRWARVLTVLFVGIILFLICSRVLSEFHPLSTAAAAMMTLALILCAVVVPQIHRLMQRRAEITNEAEAIYRYLAEIPEVGQAVGAKFLDPVSKSIIFESVHYEKNSKVILDKLDLRLATNSRTAVVSLDPWEAKAIGYLLPRFIEPSSGRVLFDSEDTAWATLESLRAETIYVGGDDPVFTGTVLENITCGESRFSLQHATEAAKLTHAHQFITDLPYGYETMLGEHGEKLDAGQSFRLSLARAIVRNPALLIIEEPKIPLDEDTKALIDDAYQRIKQGRTIIYIPSRLSTVRSCDQVIFLQNGKLVAVGPHAELVKQNDVYRHWEYINFSDLAKSSSSKP